jgi:prepilin-type N-terminal cleavage/methylation domain-containing protein
MSRRTSYTRSNRRGRLSRRAGFSLIEILVVIGLIAFLTAALVAVVPRVANASKVAATRATIKKVDELLNDRINGFRRWIQRQDQQAGSGIPSYVDLGIYQQVGNNLQVAKAICIKKLFAQAFAQTYSELPNSIQTANPRTGPQGLGDSAGCLYLILTKGPLFDTEPPSAADLKAIEIADTDGDGIPEIVDAWGQPLRFYRWPTRLVRPSTASPPNAPGQIDEVPLIPPSPLTLTMIGAAPRTSLPVWIANHAYNVGDKIVSGAAATTGYSLVYQCVVAGTSSGANPFPGPSPIVGTTITDGGVTWQLLLDPLSIDPDDPYSIAATAQPNWLSETPSSSSPVPAITPNTWSVPLIVSCGTDGQLGLYEPNDFGPDPTTSHFGNLAQPQPDTTDPTQFNRNAMYDNITNHQP